MESGEGEDHAEMDLPSKGSHTTCTLGGSLAVRVPKKQSEVKSQNPSRRERRETNFARPKFPGGAGLRL